MNRIEWINLYTSAVHHWNTIIALIVVADNGESISIGNTAIHYKEIDIGYCADDCSYCVKFASDCCECPLHMYEVHCNDESSSWFSFSLSSRRYVLRNAITMRDTVLRCKPKQISDYKIPVF